MSLSPSLEPNGRAPIPLEAHFTLPFLYLEVIFDCELQPGRIDSRNWRVHYNKRMYEGVIIDAAGFRVTGTMCDDGGCPAGNFVHYIAIPPDLKGLDGTPVEEFDLFPIT